MLAHSTDDFLVANCTGAVTPHVGLSYSDPRRGKCGGACTGFSQVALRSDIACSHRLEAVTTTDPRASELRRPDGDPVRILVVDDEPTLSELLQMALRYEGCDVRIAATGHAAVRAAKEFQPDAIVLDMMLPDLDGIEVLRRVRGHRPAVPVLFLTARDSVEDRIAGLTAGGVK